MATQISSLTNTPSGSSSTNQSVSLLYDIESVFKTGYIKTSKAALYNGNTNANLLIAQKSLTAQSVYFTILDKDQNPESVYWRIIVTELSEDHSETNSHHNTLSDSSAIFATGASPIQISISGKLLVSKTDDDSFAFLQNYITAFRLRSLEQNKKILFFICKDTTFKLIISSINLQQDINTETYYDIVILGLAYSYKMSLSTEELNWKYYGKAAPVATSGKMIFDEEQAGEQTQSATDPQVNRLTNTQQTG